MAALQIEIEEVGEVDGEGKEEVDWTLRALGDLEFLTQDAELSGKSLIDSRNGLNDLSRLSMLWIVQKCWPEGARFVFN